MKNKALRITSVISSLTLLILFVLYKAGTFSLPPAEIDAEHQNAIVAETDNAGANDDGGFTEVEGLKGVSWADVTGDVDEMMGGSKSVVIELNKSADLSVAPDSRSDARK